MMKPEMGLQPATSRRANPRLRWLKAICVCGMLSNAPAAAAPPFWATDHVADNGFCRVKRTTSGFVALRTGPNAASRAVARMAADDGVMIKRSQKGDWLEVTWWRGQSRRLKGFDSYSGKGWVRRAFIGENCE